MAEQKMTKAEYDQYTHIKNERKLNSNNQHFIATMHARIFNHDMHIPCGCSPKTWQQWIAQLNSIYENGYSSST